MPLIKQDVLLGIADRIAAQYKFLKEAMDQACLGQNYQSRISATGDVDVQVTLLAPYVSVDNAFTMTKLIQSFNVLNVAISSMDNHFAQMDSVGSWDGYLATHDIRVSEYFNEVYKTRGGGPLLAINVFSEKILTFSTITVGDGVLDFVDGDNFGPGINMNLRADGRNFAPQQLGIYFENPCSEPIDLIVSAKDWEGDVYDVAVSLEAGTEFAPIGNDSSKFMDVVNVRLSPNGNAGKSGDVFKIKNIKEREIKL